MQTLLLRRDHDRCYPIIIWIAVCVVLVGAGRAAIAQNTASKSSPLDLIHALEGMRFVGPLSVEGETSPDEDVLSFNGGKLASEVCIRYGFAPALYWVRRDAGGLHFIAELESPDNGKIRFEGVTDGKQMSATALWTKERWYWTIEQKLHFKGQRHERKEQL